MTTERDDAQGMVTQLTSALKTANDTITELETELAKFDNGPEQYRARQIAVLIGMPTEMLPFAVEDIKADPGGNHTIDKYDPYSAAPSAGRMERSYPEARADWRNVELRVRVFRRGKVD